ncbi:hypothetical protein MKW98_016360, partial [Papaver atlanticum]
PLTSITVSVDGGRLKVKLSEGLAEDCSLDVQPVIKYIQNGVILLHMEVERTQSLIQVLTVRIWVNTKEHHQSG